MIYLGTAVALAFALWSKNAKNRFEKQSFRRLLVDNSFELSVCVTLVGAVFCVLSGWASALDDPRTGLKTLQTVESQLQSVARVVSAVKLGPWSSIAILCASALIGAAADRGRGRLTARRKSIKAAQRRFDQYQKWTKRAGMVVAVFSSVSFFGGSIDGAVAPLRARITAVHTDWIAFTHDVSAALTTDVSSQLATRAAMTAPPAYREALEKEESRSASLTTFLTEYERDWKRLGLDGTAMDASGDELRSRRTAQEALAARAAEVQRDLFQVATAREAHGLRDVGHPPARASQSTIGESRDELRAADAKIAERLAAAPSKKIASSLIGLALSPKSLPLLGEAVKAFPVLEPLIGVVASAVSNRVVDEIELRASTLARESMQTGAPGNTSLKGVATQIAARIPLDWNTASARGVSAAVESEARAASMDVRTVYAARFERALNERNAQLSSKVRDSMSNLKQRIRATGRMEAIARKHLEELLRSRRFEIGSAATGEDSAADRFFNEPTARLPSGRVTADPAAPAPRANPKTELSTAALDDIVASIETIADAKEKNACLTQTLSLLDSAAPLAAKLRALPEAAGLGPSAELSKRVAHLEVEARRLAPFEIGPYAGHPALGRAGFERFARPGLEGGELYRPRYEMRRFEAPRAMPRR